MVLIICIAIVAYQDDSQTTLSTPEQIFEEQKETKNQTAELGLNPLHPVSVEDSIGYSLQNNQLNITYDNGKSWTTVPVGISELFSGEYNGNQQELIVNSFVLKKSSFLICGWTRFGEPTGFIEIFLRSGKYMERKCHFRTVSSNSFSEISIFE